MVKLNLSGNKTKTMILNQNNIMANIGQNRAKIKLLTRKVNEYCL